MASYFIQLALCVFFSVFHRHRGCQRADKSFPAFYTTTVIMALSIAVASAATFAEKRAAPSSVRSDLRLPNIYEYRLLALAPAFAVLPVLVAYSLSRERRLRRPEPQPRRGPSWPIPLGRPHHRSRRRPNPPALLPRVLTSAVCLLCMVVVWVIWAVGEQGRKSPVRFVFGSGLDVRVSGFLYERAGAYTLAVACWTTALPALGAASRCLRHGGGRRRPAGPVFRGACILLALVEWVMLMYIRTKAVEDGQGHTSETEIGFGQILALFTWFPVLFILAVGVGFPGVDDAKG